MERGILTNPYDRATRELFPGAEWPWKCRFCGKTFAVKPDHLNCCAQSMKYATRALIRNFYCDFCSRPEPRWTFMAERIIAQMDDGTVVDYEEEWGACNKCKNLIVAGKKNQLFEWCSKALFEQSDRASRPKHERTAKYLNDRRVQLKKLLDTFWTAKRDTPPIPEDPATWVHDPQPRVKQLGRIQSIPEQHTAPDREDEGAGERPAQDEQGRAADRDRD